MRRRVQIGFGDDLEALDIGVWRTVILPSDEAGDGVPVVEPGSFVDPVIGFGNDPVTGGASVGLLPHEAFFVSHEFPSSESSARFARRLAVVELDLMVDGIP